MNEIKKQKIQRFLMDEAMAQAVYEVLVESFMEEISGADVHTLAAQTLSVNGLKKGWRRLDRYRSEVESEKPKLVQVGL